MNRDRPQGIVGHESAKLEKELAAVHNGEEESTGGWEVA
jgi:hypothetical protein